MPDWVLQKKIDRLGTYIENKFSGLKKFNTWLRSNGHGAWYTQLATFLVKLPVRAAYNIIHLVFSIIKGILYTAIHPLKGLNRIAKQIILLIDALTKPETWSKIGAGSMGAVAGQALIFAHPISLIAAGIGGALVVGGVSLGALKAAIQAERGEKTRAVRQNFKNQLSQLPESLLTGFLVGLLIGAVRKVISERKAQTQSKHETSQNKKYQSQSEGGVEPASLTNFQAHMLSENFLNQHNLPVWGCKYTIEKGGVVLNWDANQLGTIAQQYPHHCITNSDGLSNFQVFLKPHGGGTIYMEVMKAGHAQPISMSFEKFFAV